MSSVIAWGLTVGEKVPEPFVRIFVANRDAWFPRQRDVDSVLEDLPSEGSLSQEERDVLVEYLTTRSIAKRDAARVKRSVLESPVSDRVDPDDLSIRSLPLAGSNLFDSTQERVDQQTTPEQGTTVSDSPGTSEEPSVVESQPEKAVEDTNVMEIPGIAELRGAELVNGGFDSVARIAAARPADIAEATSLGDQLATVAVEGARERVGYEVSTSTRLARETGVSEETFDAALSPLAASGVPPSEAAPVLRILFGPSVIDIEAVTGQQAYYLWEAGYRTPKEIAEASVDELIEVRHVGEKTAPRIREGAMQVMSNYQ